MARDFSEQICKILEQKIMTAISYSNFSVTDRWDWGFTGYINFSTTQKTSDGWTLEFDSPFKIYEIWGAEIVSHKGNHYVIKNVDWNKNIAPNENISVGFNGYADKGSEIFEPNNYIINSKIMNETNTPIDTLEYKIIDQWEGGFVSEITLTPCETSLDGAPLFEFDAPFKITEIWGAEIVSQQGNHYTIKDNWWNADDKAVKNYSFAFKAQGNVKDAPSNFVYSGQLLKDGEMTTLEDKPASSSPVSTDTKPEPITVVPEPQPATNVGGNSPVDSNSETEMSTQIDSLSYKIIDQWEGGFVSEITLTPGETSLDGTPLFEFDAPFKITEIWGAEIVSQQGNHYTIKDDWWNADDKAVKNYSFAFKAEGNVKDAPSNFIYNGESLDSTVSEVTPFPSTPSNANETDTDNTPSISGSVSRPDYNQSSGFFTLDGKLYDANGNEFIARGINNLHVYFDDNDDNLNQAYDALDNIAGFGFNSVRINWLTEFLGRNTNDAMLESIIQRTIDLKMVPIVELHDFTGSPDTQKFLDKGVKWWTDRANLWDKYENQLLINIANEFGDFEMTKGGNRQIFPNVYKEAINRLRNAGIDNTLVIDSFEWSKDYTLITEYGQEIYNHDPQKNLMFDVHFYSGQGESEAKITDAIESISGQKLPFMVGEFADMHPAYGKGEGVIDDVKEQHIMSEAEKYGVGYLGWAWHNDPFSVAANWEATSTDQLTSWGKTLIEGPNGIANTSETATIFG
jgi:mannan endo-1,4-beta-mannosidase